LTHLWEQVAQVLQRSKQINNSLELKRKNNITMSLFGGCPSIAANSLLTVTRNFAYRIFKT